MRRWRNFLYNKDAELRTAKPRRGGYDLYRSHLSVSSECVRDYRIAGWILHCVETVGKACHADDRGREQSIAHELGRLVGRIGLQWWQLGFLTLRSHNPGCRFSVKLRRSLRGNGGMMVHVLGLDSKTRLISPCGRTRRGPLLPSYSQIQYPGTAEISWYRTMPIRLLINITPPITQ